MFEKCTITIYEGRAYELESGIVNFSIDGRNCDFEKELKEIVDMLLKQGKSFVVDRFYINEKGQA